MRIISLFIIWTIINAQVCADVPQNVGAPFNAKEIVERVAHSPQMHGQTISWSRDGEFLIDTNVVYGPAPYEQGDPAIAFDGTNYLVVWQDLRNSVDYDIYGARVNQSGAIIDSAGIAICIVADDQYCPAVAFDGTNYLVVWQEGGSGTIARIYGARINASGILIDSTGIVISNGANYGQFAPAVAFDGTNYLVAWEEYIISGTHSYDINGTRVTPAGSVLNPNGFAIANSDYDKYRLAIAFDDTNYLVVWQENRSGSSADIYGARVNTSGIVLDPAGIIISDAPDAQGFPSVAFGGTDYLVVWTDSRDGSYANIYGARVKRSGQVIDTNGIAISAVAGWLYNPAVAFDGDNYSVVWPQGPNICGARLDTAGNVLDTTGTIGTAISDAASPSIAFGGNNYLVAWQSYSQDIYGARIDTSGNVLEPQGILISLATYAENSSSAAFDGSNYLIVWQDYRNGAPDIYGARVDQAGTVLDPASIAISNAANNQWFPSVAFDGTNYLVLWIDFRSGSSWDVYATRVNQTGTVLDTSGILIATNGIWLAPPVAAFDGTNYLIVWGNYDVIYGVRMDTSGNIIDSSNIVISAGSFMRYAPAIVFDGTYYFVVWQDFRSMWISQLYGARVTTSSTVLDPAGIAICNGSHDQVSPSVISDGTNCLVVWSNIYYPSNASDMYGARIHHSGTVLDPSSIPICTAAYNQSSPSVIFDGTDYMVVWQDFRSGSNYDIYGAKLNQAGTVIDAFAVSQQSGNQTCPFLVKGGGDGVFVIYAGFCDYVNTHPANALRIWGTFCAPTGIAENTLRSTPNALHQLQVYPNPFHESVNIKFQIPSTKSQGGVGSGEERIASLKIYDATGRLVKNFPLLTSHFYQLVWH